MDHQILPKQPPLFISYFKVGRLLYITLFLFVAESIFFLELFKYSIVQSKNFLSIIWFICFLFSFVHIFLVIMDGWSRFQNYKRIKDQFYLHGFDPRLAATYTGSKCQRNAALVAAMELGKETELKNFYRKTGIKWFHFIPYFMLQDPLFLIRKSFWSRTFLEKSYKSKFNFRTLYQLREN